MSSKRDNSPFSENEIEQVWKKASDIKNDPVLGIIGKDVCGATMQRSAYGNRDSKYGWEIDHIQPVSKGGTDSIDNLQPLHWKNNASKADQPNVPRTWCVI